MTRKILLKVHGLMTIIGLFLVSPIQIASAQEQLLNLGNPWSTSEIEETYGEVHSDVNWGYYLGEFFDLPPNRFIFDLRVQLSELDLKTASVVDDCKNIQGDWSRVACVMSGISDSYSENYGNKVTSFKIVRNLRYALNSMEIESLFLSNKYFGHGSHGHTGLIIIFKNSEERVYSYFIDPVRLPGFIYPISKDSIVYHDTDGDGLTDNFLLPVIN